MSIYWSGRDGKTPPPNATFCYIPFNGKIQTAPLKQVSLPSPQKAKVLKRDFFPHKETWKNNIEKALQLIEGKSLQKAVLARKIRLELETAPDPFAIAASLPKEGAYHFCLQLEDKAFLGASPERLFKRKKDLLFSEALAATRPRGKTADEDRALEEDLLRTKKDLVEFRFVQDYVREILSSFCDSVVFAPISVHKTKYVQHLYSQCEAKLMQGVSDEEILSYLHPTPALCGTPKPIAYSLIEELEPFDRGLYGGILGWHTPEESEYIVGIRSCLIEGKVATLFSGTGIVHGSDAEKEWEELNHKVRLYDAVLVD